MGIILKRGRDGTYRKHWYGKYDVDGKAHVFNLAVPVKGKTPANLWKRGDAAFERSRKEAQTEYIRTVEQARGKGRAEYLVERLIEMKTGRSVDHVRIADLADRWLSMPRDGKLTPAYVAGIKSACRQFKVFMRTRKPKDKPAAVYLYEVTQPDAGTFVEKLRERLSVKSVKEYVGLLRSAFRRFLPPGVANPFEGIVTRRNRETAGEDSIHRKPFTAEELERLLKAAQDDTFLYPLVVTAACTGMRRGDVATLRWRDVDLQAGMLLVKTSKTGAQVEIPIFSPLRNILEERKDNGSEYVFPQAFLMMQGVPNPAFREGDDKSKQYRYKPNPGGLTWRFKALVARALAKEKPKHPPTPPDPAVILAEGLAAIDCMPEGQRRDHTRDTFTRYMAGTSLRQIVKQTGFSKPAVSGWLSDVSGMIGKPVIRNRTDMDVRNRIAEHTRVVREKGQGQRSASIRDWHALRATWVTLALTAGVPMELVRRVTGHATVEIVLKHYFRPGREQFKAILAGALPAVLTGVKSEKLTPAEELQSLSDKAKTGTLTDADRKRLHIVAKLV